MQSDPLAIEQSTGPKGQRVLTIVGTIVGPIVLNNLFPFQAQVHIDRDKDLVMDLSGVPYLDSAGVGVLVAAGVSRQNNGCRLLLAGTNERVHGTLKVTRVEDFFHFFDTMEAALAG